VTAHTLVRVQHPWWKVMIYLSRYGHKLLRRNAVTCQPITGGRQYRTLATLPKAFHEEPGRMLSRVRRSMCRRLLRTPKISQKFAGEWNCLCSATTGTKQHWVSFNFDSIISRHFFQGTWQCKCWLFENSQTASRAAQNALAGHMRAACLRPLV